MAPITCTVMSGIMATSATTPKASATRFPPSACDTPMQKGSMKAAVMGPLATPPESKAMAVKIRGTKNDMMMAARYPGTKKA